MAGAHGSKKSAPSVKSAGLTPATRIGTSGPIVRTFARPLKLRVEIGEPPTEVRVLDGAQGWRNGKAVTGPGYEAMLLQAVRLDLPFQLLSNQPKLVEKEPMDYHGVQLRVLELPLENGLSITAGLDPKTGRILFSTGNTPASGPMGRLSFETSYSDFSVVDGVLFAFNEVNLAGGTKTADIVLSLVQLLKSAPADAFKP
jgi:hypothetical protein